jgi:hypothetical protein
MPRLFRLETHAGLGTCAITLSVLDRLTVAIGRNDALFFPGDRILQKSRVRLRGGFAVAPLRIGAFYCGYMTHAPLLAMHHA